MNYDYPSLATYPFLLPKAMEWGSVRVSAYNNSATNGSGQELTLPGTRWKIGVTYRQHTYDERRKLDAVLKKLNGAQHGLNLWHMAAPVPRGTCNLAGVQVSSVAAQFATTITLKNCGASKTLLDGDMFKVITSTGEQLLMVQDDWTANGSGVMTVNFVHMLRGSVAVNSAVTLSYPTIPFECREIPDTPFGSQNMCPEFGLTFTERF